MDHLFFCYQMEKKTYAYRKGNKLYYVERKPPYIEAIKSESKELELLMKPVEEKAVVIATVPLTRNEKWFLFESNRIYMFQNGTINHHYEEVGIKNEKL